MLYSAILILHIYILFQTKRASNKTADKNQDKDKSVDDLCLDDANSTLAVHSASTSGREDSGTSAGNSTFLEQGVGASGMNFIVRDIELNSSARTPAPPEHATTANAPESLRLPEMTFEDFLNNNGNAEEFEEDDDHILSSTDSSSVEDD